MSWCPIIRGLELPIYYINDFNSAPAPLIIKQDGLLQPSTLFPLYNLFEFRGLIYSSSPASFNCNLAKQENLLSPIFLPPSPCNLTGQEDPPHFNTLPPSDSEQSEQEDLLQFTSYRPHKAILEYYILLILDLLFFFQACSTYSLK